MSLWAWIKGSKGNPGFIEYTVGEYIVRATVDLTCIKTRDDLRALFDDFANRVRDEMARQGRHQPGENIYIIKRCRVSESVSALLTKLTEGSEEEEEA